MTPSQIKLLADLRSGAVRLVPGEATPDMRAAAYPMIEREETSRALIVWEAMVKASPDLSASLAEMIEGLVGERDAARRRLAKAMLYPAVPAPSTPEAEVKYWIGMATRERLSADELDKELTAAESRVSALEAALAPFAKEADRIYAAETCDTIGDSCEIWQCGDFNMTRSKITYGDLRRARALSQETHDVGE